MFSGDTMNHSQPLLGRARKDRSAQALTRRVAAIAAAAVVVSGSAVAAHADPPDRSSIGAPQRLRADGLTDPLGIDTTRPTLSWGFGAPGQDTRQSAYEIRAASSAQLLRAGKPDLWDTGVVHSADNAAVDYAGTPVDSRDDVFWQVRVWDQAGTPSAWSSTAHWEVGLLHAADWSAQWIGNPAWEQPTAYPMPVSLSTPATGRYVRVTVTRPRPTARPAWSSARSRSSTARTPGPTSRRAPR
jgi:alpha-L-rhamnosidase